MGIEATRRLPKANHHRPQRQTVVKGTWSINECQGKRDIEWAKGIHSIWACYVFSQVLNVTSSRILSRILFVTFTEQNATMGDPFLVNVTSCCGFLSISSISDLQEPPKTTSHFGKFTWCWPLHSSTFLNKTPKLRPRYVNLTTCTTLKKARKESGPPGFCVNSLDLSLRMWSEMIRVRMLWNMNDKCCTQMVIT